MAKVNIPAQEDSARKIQRRSAFNNLFLLFILLLAFFIRLMHFYPYDMLPDEAHYLWHAGKIHEDLSHAGSSSILRYHSPLFPFLISFFYSFADPEWISRIALVVINLIGIWGIYLVGLHVGGVFVGLFSALMLALNPAYIEYADRVMADAPLTVFSLFFILMILKVSDKSRLREYFLLGLMGSVVILLKWAGILLFPFIAATYFLILKKQPLWSRMLRIIVSFVPMMLTVGFLLFTNLISTGRALPSLSALRGVGGGSPFWYYFVNFQNIFLIGITIPFFIYGFFLCFVRNAGKLSVLGVWFVLFFFGISILREKDARYALVVLPAVLLIASLGLKNFLEKNFPEKILLAARGFLLGLLLLSFSWPSVGSVKGINQFPGRSLGFQKAWAWFSVHLPLDAVIMTPSLRLTRYYGKQEDRFTEENIIFLPTDKRKFQALVEAENGPIFILIDRWKIQQSSWFYPVSEETIKKLKESNFFLAKAIKGCVFEKGRKVENVPVVWIFERRPQQP